MAGKVPRGSSRWESGSARPFRSRWRPGIWWVVAGIATVTALLAVLSLTFNGSETPVRENQGSVVDVGSSDLPNFPVVLYQGQNIVGSREPRFYSLLGSKPMVLNYWASNCPPCAAEMPEFEKVWQRYKDQVLFVGLDVGRFVGFGNAEISKKELRELGVTYVAGTPPNFEIVRELEVLGLPTTVFLTPDGKVHKKWSGTLNESKLTELVQELLQA